MTLSPWHSTPQNINRCREIGDKLPVFLLSFAMPPLRNPSQERFNALSWQKGGRDRMDVGGIEKRKR